MMMKSSKMWTVQTLSLLSVGLSGVVAFPAGPISGASISEIKDINPIACSNTFCIAEKHPVYNSTTETCTCEWIPGLGPTSLTVRAASASSTTPIPSPLPTQPSCYRTGLICIPEMHLVYNGTSQRCECEWIPGLGPTPIPTILSKRNVGCNGVACIAEKYPVFNATSGHCECEWIPGFEPGGIYNPSSPATVVARQRSNDCSGSGLACISEQHLVYNTTSGKCECEWISPFQPPSIIPPWPTTTPVATPVAIVERQRYSECFNTGLVCIPEMRLVFNTTSGVCECEWIPGFEPPTASSAAEKRDACSDIACIAEMEPVLNATTNTCSCEWIPGFEPGGIYNPGPCAGVMCIAEQHPVPDWATYTCTCEWIRGLEPTVTAIAK